MPLAFTIDGLPRDGAPSFVPPPGAPPQALRQALDLVRWAAGQGLRDAQQDMAATLDDKLFWVRVGVGVSAGASLLALLAVLAEAASRPRGGVR